MVTRLPHRHLGGLSELTDSEHGYIINDTFPNGTSIALTETMLNRGRQEKLRRHTGA